MRRSAAAAVALLFAAACSSDPAPPAATPRPPTTVPTPAEPSDAPAILLAAGDIASCESSGDEATADLLAMLVAAQPDAVVATLGDNVYDAGAPAEFARCYDPSWGRFRDRTRPAVGNHDSATPGAAAYRAYFGIGPPNWYSYELGTWHVVVLDSNCSIAGCASGGVQERWLRDDLAASSALCTLAYWHHPRFSSGTVHGSVPAVTPLFRALADAGADVVLAGHEHNYERFAPVEGIRSFVVGTGGRSHYPFGQPVHNSEVRHTGTFGVLHLSLRADGDDWRFAPAAGGTFEDRGSDRCH